METHKNVDLFGDKAEYTIDENSCFLITNYNPNHKCAGDIRVPKEGKRIYAKRAAYESTGRKKTAKGRICCKHNIRCVNPLHMVFIPWQKEIKYEIDENGCHICTSHKQDTSGYPIKQIYKEDIKTGKAIKTKTYKMHRYIYEKTNNTILSRWELVRHKCDNKLCINPDHLEIGTHQDNMDDMVKRGRSNKGKTHTKLTKVQVLEIYNSEKTGKELSEIYEITIHSVYRIKNRKVYKNWIPDKYGNVEKSFKGLTKPQVLDIYNSTDKFVDIAARYGIRTDTVGNIKNRRSHKAWLPDCEAGRYKRLH